MSDALLDRLGSSTGQERLEVRRVIGEGTVSLVREHMDVPGALGMVGWLAGATTPAEYEATVQISVPVGALMVLAEAAAANVAAVLGDLSSRARVKPTLRLTTAPAPAPALRAAVDAGSEDGPTSDERAAMRAMA